MSEEGYRPATCPACGGDFEFPESLAGTEAECPHCSASLVLASAESPTGGQPGHAGTSPEALDASRLATAFRGHATHHAPPWTYHASVIGVCVALLLLPLAYLALVGGLTVALAAFAWNWFTWVRVFLGTEDFQAVAAVAYVFGLFLGGFVLLFLIKPLFARAGRSKAVIRLDPAREPLFFAFLHMVCDTVGAPHPESVHVDCRLNASAGLRRDPRGAGGRELTLSLGLPLVACLSMRQLAGVLAHEFGHFNQRVGMRASRIVGAVNAWLTRVAYQRDAWDEALDTWIHGAPDWRTTLVSNLAAFGVRLSRGVLKSLVHIGRALSCALLRRMETEADRVQIEVAGSTESEATFRHLHLLQALSRAHYRDLRTRWERTGILPDNFPASLALALAGTDEEKRERIGLRVDHEEPSLFATHPLVHDRIRLAQDSHQVGLFDLEGPATRLFAEFETLSKQATLAHYRDALRLPPESIHVTPVPRAP